MKAYKITLEQYTGPDLTPIFQTVWIHGKDSTGKHICIYLPQPHKDDDTQATQLAAMLNLPLEKRTLTLKGPHWKTHS